MTKVLLYKLCGELGWAISISATHIWLCVFRLFWPQKKYDLKWKIYGFLTFMFNLLV